METLDKWKLCLLVVYWPCHDIGSDCWSLPLLSSIQLALDQLIQSSLWIRLSFPLQLITSSVIFHKNCSCCSQHQQQQQQQQQLALEQWAQSLLSKYGSDSDVFSYWSLFLLSCFGLMNTILTLIKWIRLCCFLLLITSSVHSTNRYVHYTKIEAKETTQNFAFIWF